MESFEKYVRLGTSGQDMLTLQTYVHLQKTYYHHICCTDKIMTKSVAKGRN